MLIQAEFSVSVELAASDFSFLPLGTFSFPNIPVLSSLLYASLWSKATAQVRELINQKQKQVEEMQSRRPLLPTSNAILTKISKKKKVINKSVTPPQQSSIRSLKIVQEALASREHPCLILFIYSKSPFMPNTAGNRFSLSFFFGCCFSFCFLARVWSFLVFSLLQLETIICIKSACFQT